MTALEPAAAGGLPRRTMLARRARALACLLVAGLAATCAAEPPSSLEQAPAAEPGSPPSVEARLERFEFLRMAMGSEARIVLHASDEPSARHAAIAAFEEIEAVEQAISDWRDSSEIRLVERRLLEHPGEAAPISSTLASCLARSIEVSRASDGAFDVTIAPVVSLWRTARRAGGMPPGEARRGALELVGWQRVSVHEGPPTTIAAPAGTRFDFGAIGKGFGADRALGVLRRRGFPRAMVDLGGDFAVGEAPPDADGWRIEVRTGLGDERIVLVLTNCGVATSGDLEQFAEIDGVRYSHLVDPRTGLGLTTPIAVTVIAPDGATADALASATSVLGVDRAGGVLQRFDASARAVTRSPGEPTDAPAKVVTFGDWSR